MSDKALSILSMWGSVGLAVSVGIIVTGNPIYLVGFIIAFFGTVLL